jgi:hypothetical protein
MPPGMLLFHLEVNFAVNQHIQEAEDKDGGLCQKKFQIQFIEPDFKSRQRKGSGSGGVVHS